MTLATVVGHENLSADQIFKNLKVSINFLVSLLKKGLIKFKLLKHFRNLIII